MKPQETELLQGCADLDAAIAFFRDELGFRLESVFPADDPVTAVVAGPGTRLRLERGAVAPPATLLVRGAEPRELESPDGTRVLVVPPAPLPGLRSTLQHTSDDPAARIPGRAGMLYRDLVPDRQGGRFIASHIHIPTGGPVPDYVHHHDVRFQLIYCWRGRVQVVYEDQGPPFWLEPGDCVLQPPHIRHRVLHCDGGLDVIEIASPARHETHVDHELRLPTERVLPERDFGGQRFARHVASAAGAGVRRDLGLAAATSNLASAFVVRSESILDECRANTGEFLFLFVLEGSVAVEVTGAGRIEMRVGDALTVPRSATVTLVDASPDAEHLEVALPARS